MKGQFKQLILWFSKQMSSIWTFKYVCVCVEEDTKGKKKPCKAYKCWMEVNACLSKFGVISHAKRLYYNLPTIHIITKC